MAGIDKIFDFAKQFSPANIAYDAIKNKKMPDIPFSPISAIAHGKLPAGPAGGAIGFANTLISGGKSKKSKKSKKGKVASAVETATGSDKTFG